MKHDYDLEQDDYEDLNSKGQKSRIYLLFGISAFILIILLMAFIVNGNSSGNDPYIKNTMTAASTSEDESSSAPATQSSLRSQDLSFWDMADTSTASLETTEKEQPSMDSVTKDQGLIAGGKQKSSVSDNDMNDNEGKTQVTHADGSTEWVNINKAIKADKYLDTGFQKENGIMHYYENGKDISFAGADISKSNGTVDFNALKKSGISFVMIKLGSRGYDTGKVTLDSSFATNIQGAEAAGLDVGIYFYSQAVTDQEAMEEVNFVIQNLKGYTITYPVAIDMELVSNDTSRIEKLSAADKTKITATFMSGIQAAGYIPAVYGNKEWLLTKINLPSITTFKIWLSQPEDLPDYPYQFVMWQYSTNGKVNGISGDTDLDISMIDFSAR